MLMTTNTLRAQDTACGIVWYPPIQLSPGITAVDEMNPSIAVQGDTVHVTWALSSQKFPYRRSVNGGQTFEPIRELAPESSQVADKCFVVATSTGTYGFWITLPQEVGFVTYSSDGGTIWTHPRIVADSLGAWPAHAGLHDTVAVILGRYDLTYKLAHSTNTGLTWSTAHPNIVGNDPRIAMTPGVVHRVTYWGFDSSDVWSEFVVQYRKSTDLGETWSDSVNLSTMNTAAYEPAIAADGSGDSATVLTAWKDVKYGCFSLGGCSVIGRLSANTGSLFEPEIRLDQHPAGSQIITAVCGNMIGVSWTDENGLDVNVLTRISMDGGGDWCPVYDHTPGLSYALGPSIAIEQNTVHLVFSELIGGPSGRWRVFYRRGVLLPTSASEQPGGTLPPFVTLDQNYPNPFNPTTAIRYQLPTAGIVSLSVYDVLGREIRALVSERMDAGTHQAVWDASGVPSGVYYYRLSLADQRGTIFTQTKKMIIIH